MRGRVSRICDFETMGGLSVDCVVMVSLINSGKDVLVMLFDALGVKRSVCGWLPGEDAAQNQNTL